MPFNTTNYVSAQVHLNLPISELIAGSYLRSQFANLEQIDNLLGEETKVLYVQNLLSELDDLKQELDSDRANELTIGTNSFEVQNQYKIGFNGTNKDGLLTGKIQQYEKYLRELKRELGYEFSTDYHQEIGALIV